MQFAYLVVLFVVCSLDALAYTLACSEHASESLERFTFWNPLFATYFAYFWVAWFVVWYSRRWLSSDRKKREAWRAAWRRATGIACWGIVNVVLLTGTMRSDWGGFGPGELAPIVPLVVAMPTGFCLCLARKSSRLRYDLSLRRFAMITSTIALVYNFVLVCVLAWFFWFAPEQEDDRQCLTPSARSSMAIAAVPAGNRVPAHSHSANVTQPVLPHPPSYPRSSACIGG